MHGQPHHRDVVGRFHESGRKPRYGRVAGRPRSVEVERHRPGGVRCRSHRPELVGVGRIEGPLYPYHRPAQGDGLMNVSIRLIAFPCSRRPWLEAVDM